MKFEEWWDEWISDEHNDNGGDRHSASRDAWQAARRATREECAVLVEGLSGVLDVHDMHNAGEEYTSEEGTLRNIAAAIRALAQEDGG